MFANANNFFFQIRDPDLQSILFINKSEKKKYIIFFSSEIVKPTSISASIAKI